MVTHAKKKSVSVVVVVCKKEYREERMRGGERERGRERDGEREERGTTLLVNTISKKREGEIMRENQGGEVV